MTLAERTGGPDGAVWRAMSSPSLSAVQGPPGSGPCTTHHIPHTLVLSITGPKGSGGDVPHEGQEHTGCRQVKGQKHTECRTEALSAERIRDVATRGSPPTIYMVGVRAKIHGHTRDYHPGLAPGVHTQPAARAICTLASRRITRGFQHARPNPNLVIISCHSGPGRDTYCSQK